MAGSASERLIRDAVAAFLRRELPQARLAWRAVAQASVVYTDRGISGGMRHGIAAAEAAGVPVEYRTLGEVSA